MTRSAQIGLAAALLLLGGATFAMAQNGPPLEDTQQRGGTRIFMASTATTLATTASIRATRLWLATGTITALSLRGGAMTRNRPVKCAGGFGVAPAIVGAGGL
jgi:hypothetical protein